MLSKVISASVIGIDANVVQVEVDLSNGIPSFTMTGYLGERVREAGDRVRTAIKNIGYKIPSSRIVINVSPASIRKSGTMLDLPVAIGILCDLGIIGQEQLEDVLIAGELSLDGSINDVCGVLPMVSEACKQGIYKCIIPEGNVREASLVGQAQIIGVSNLEEVIAALNGEVIDKERLSVTKSGNDGSCGSEVDYLDVCGQFAAKRAIMIAAAGRHNLLMSGPPGSGKTLLASRISTILPELTEEEIIEVSKIYSVAGLLDNKSGCISKRPFRSPHHTITQSALIGGGIVPIPGEITLAHKGVLFLDELTKFKSSVLECLRQPMEERAVNLIRSGSVCHFPANFMLVGAMNPCKCGFYPDRNYCNCSEIDIIRHVGRLSRPFMDRFDLAVHIDKPDYEELAGSVSHKKICGVLREDTTYMSGLGSAKMKAVVAAAVEIQQRRYRNMNISFNSELSSNQLKKFCILDEKGEALMKTAYERYNMSARGYGKVLKVARTIADIEGSEQIVAAHVSEAICFRNLEVTGYGNG